MRSRSAYFPPGTSKWNKIEHRLFSFITLNWRGKPLVSLETIINLIAGTTNSAGLEVYARLDKDTYPDKIKVTNTEFTAVNIAGHEFHPEWTHHRRHTITEPAVQDACRHNLLRCFSTGLTVSC